MFPRLIEKIR